MPLKRFIHGEMFSSEDYCSLSFGARLLWIGLFGKVADDEGRGKASPAYLKAEVFPLDQLEADQVEKWRGEIHLRQMIHLYKDGDRELFEIRSWPFWQRPRYIKPSKYPSFKDPPNSPQISENNRTGRVGLGRVGLGKEKGVGLGKGSEGKAKTEPGPPGVSRSTSTPNGQTGRGAEKDLKRVQAQEGLKAIRRDLGKEAAGKIAEGGGE